MKNISCFIVCFVSLLSTVCSKDVVIQEPGGQPEPYTGTKDSLEKIWKQIEDYIESDVGMISDERPLPDVLSEKEILVRAYSIMSKRGAFSPNNEQFINAPCLLSAKVARPSAIYVFRNDGYAYMWYDLYAVADNGEVLIRQAASAAAYLGDGELLAGGQSSYGHEEGRYAYHFITESELIELISSQFDGALPDEQPILVQLSLAGTRFSSATLFWYFTVEDVEYIVGVKVGNWNYVAANGGVSNHAAISGDNGVASIGWERMARLDTRADFYNAIRENRDTASGNRFPYPPKVFDWTAIPLN